MEEIIKWYLNNTFHLSREISIYASLAR